MLIFSDKNNKKYIKYVFIVNILFALSIQIFTWKEFKTISIPLNFYKFYFYYFNTWYIFLYLKCQEEIIENAEAQINMYLEGNSNIQIDSDKEGAIYRLFDSINQIGSILNAQAKDDRNGMLFLL